MKLTHKNIDSIIRDARRDRNLTQEQLADLVGKKRSYISRIESQSGTNIKLHTFIEIIQKGFGGNIKIEL